MPMPIHMELEGEMQGKIEGGCEMTGREGTILIDCLSHTIDIPTNPQDGQPTGQAGARPSDHCQGDRQVVTSALPGTVYRGADDGDAQVVFARPERWRSTTTRPSVRMRSSSR